MVERKYNILMNGVIVDRNLSKEEAEARVEHYIELDEDDDDGDADNITYAIRPVK